MRNKLKKIVGTLLTFALAFTMIGGDIKNVNAAPGIPNTTLRVQWSEGMSVRGIGSTAIVGYLLLDRNWVDSQSAEIKNAFGELYQFSDAANGMTADYAQMVMDDTNLENGDVYLLPLLKPGPGTIHATAPDAGTDVGPNVKGVLLAVVQGSEPGWYFNYYDRSIGAMDIGEEGLGGKGTIVIRLGAPTKEIKESSEIEDITIFGEKTWRGNGIKPLSITVKLLQNDVEIGSRIVGEAGGVWTYDFGVHPVTDNAGNEYDYEIKEIPVDGFTTTYDGFDIINTSDPVIVPVIKGTIEFLKHDDNENVLEGAVFELFDAEDTSFEHVIDTATSGASGWVRFLDVAAGNYKIKESAAPEGYLKSDVILDAVVEDEEAVTPDGTPVVNTRIRANVVVTKFGETQEVVLSGAEFTLYDDGVKVGESKVTGLDGKATFEDIPYGTYTVKETKAPAGYVLSDESEIVEIEDVDNVNVSFSNVKIKGTVQITKVDAKNHEITLQGAEFKIEDNNGPASFDGTTDEDGMLEIELPFGEYTLSEVAAPTGYEKAPGTWTIRITENDEIVELEIQNEKIEDVVVDPEPVEDEVGTVRITKVDKDNHEIVLEGAEFMIVDKDGDTIFEGTTDEDGLLETELLVGEYTLSEVTAPTGYVKAPGTWAINITVKDEILELVIGNEKIEDEEVDPEPVEDEVGTLKITKVDKDDHEIVLEGAKFKLVDKDGETVFEGITDDAGKLETELLVGNYTLSEVTAPKDYEKTTKTWTVNIKKDETFALVIENEMIEVEEVDPLPIDDEVGTLRIKKVDKETDAVLAGVRFRITDKDGDVVFEGLTDVNGMIEEELLVGEYTITEVEALPGYVPSTKPEVVKIEEDGEVMNLTIANKKMYGLVSIRKVDAESGEVLEGAKFKIVDNAGVVILEDYTDEEGMLEVWLPKGEYIISETEAPEDYDKTDETWSVKVTADGQLFKLEVENTMIEVEVVSPVTLPQTGGIPSEFLYVLGAFAIFTGMLLTKKKQSV